MKIAIVGRKGSGKDTTASFIRYFMLEGIDVSILPDDNKKEDKNYIFRNIMRMSNSSDISIIRFADSLKDFLSFMYKIPREHFEYPYKNNIFYRKDYDVQKIVRCLNGVSYRGSDIKPSQPGDDIKDYVSIRTIMQLESEKFKKGFGEDFFIKQLFKKIKKDVIIVSDCRFNNEFEALKDKGFIFIKIRNPNGEKDSHDSENQAVDIADEHFDYVIDNNEDLEKLFYICNDIAGDLKDMLIDEGKKLSSSYEVASIGQSIINLSNKNKDEISPWCSMIDSMNVMYSNLSSGGYRTYTFSAPEVGVVGNAMINGVF
nr:MAG: phosphomevalonate kinase [Bacteriophage sp.]